MRPYLAIIKDSFREAMVSKVLWVILALITLFLGLLAPIGVYEQMSTVYKNDDIVNPTGILVSLGEVTAESPPSPSKRMWELFPDDATRNQIKQLARQAGTPQAPRFLMVITVQALLNDMVGKQNLYNAEYWKDTPINDEAQQLLKLDAAKLDKKQARRLNRLLIDAAFAAQLKSGYTSEVTFAYGWWDLEWPVSGSQESWLTWAISNFVDYFLGVVGVLLAILVTATMIPRAFEAGAIDLLLSKPVSRSGVFLSKFLGGCAFVAVMTTYFILGLWLLLGLRYGFWHGRLLLCIPLMLFLFAIYYSVSALAGLLWQNGIIAVVITMAFWGVCFSLWFIKDGLEAWVMQPRAITDIVPTTGQLLAKTSGEEIVEWSAEGKWTAPSPGSVDMKLPVGMRAPMPGGTVALFDAGEDTAIMVLPRGVARYDLKKLLLGGSIDFSAISIIGPPLTLNTPFAAAMSADRKLALFDGKRLYAMVYKDDKYEIAATRELDNSQRCVMAYGGGKVLLAFADGSRHFFNDTDLAPAETYPSDGRTPRIAYAAEDGKNFAVVFQDQSVWLYDASTRQDRSGSLSGQGAISALTFSGDSLYVADAFTRVTEYKLQDLSVVRRLQPTLSRFEWIYWYPIRIPYMLFPKPGELGDMVRYLMTGEKTVGATDDPEAAREKLNIWQPFWSNLAFVSVMLFLGCWYVSRRDF